jgi:hypothetical protein
LKDHNALIWQRKSFPPTTKNRLADPSEICALDFARQFPRFRICQVSATIGINRSIFVRRHNDAASAHAAGKYRQREWRKPVCDNPCAVLRRQEISFNQGAEWNALISTYIGTIPLSGDTPCAAKHIMSASPPDAQVRSAMAAKVGAAARHSQSAAPGAAARPFPTHPPI